MDSPPVNPGPFPTPQALDLLVEVESQAFHQPRAIPQIRDWLEFSIDEEADGRIYSDSAMTLDPVMIARYHAARMDRIVIREILLPQVRQIVLTDPVEFIGDLTDDDLEEVGPPSWFLACGDAVARRFREAEAYRPDPPHAPAGVRGRFLGICVYPVPHLHPGEAYLFAECPGREIQVKGPRLVMGPELRWTERTRFEPADRRVYAFRDRRSL